MSSDKVCTTMIMRWCNVQTNEYDHSIHIPVSASGNYINYGFRMDNHKTFKTYHVRLYQRSKNKLDNISRFKVIIMKIYRNGNQSNQEYNNTTFWGYFKLNNTIIWDCCHGDKCLSGILNTWLLSSKKCQTEIRNKSQVNRASQTYNLYTEITCDWWLYKHE